jgi:hypothetical protein
MANEFLKNQDANFCGRPHVMQAEIVYNDGGMSQLHSTLGFLKSFCQLRIVSSESGVTCTQQQVFNVKYAATNSECRRWISLGFASFDEEF